jgi:hypothetical protein
MTKKYSQDLVSASIVQRASLLRKLPVEFRAYGAPSVVFYALWYFVRFRLVIYILISGYTSCCRVSMAFFDALSRHACPDFPGMRMVRRMEEAIDNRNRTRSVPSKLYHDRSNCSFRCWRNV